MCVWSKAPFFFSRVHTHTYTGDSIKKESVGHSMSVRQEQIRGAIVCGLRAGRTADEIIKFNNIAKSTVYDVKKRFEAFVAEGNDPDDFPVRSSAPTNRPRRSDDDIARVQRAVQEDPGQSMRRISAENEIPETTVRRIVHEDLMMKSYALKRGQILSQTTIQSRYERARALLNQLKAPKGRGHRDNFGLIFFSDEKNFTQDQKVNHRNHRWICEEASEVPIIGQTKFPLSVMVLGVVSSEGDVMPPHVFEQGLRVNAEVYIDVLEHKVVPWMERIAAGRPYVFQQDGAPAHTSARAQAFCARSMSHFIDKNSWPPSSPDLNPLDYFLWSVLEEDVNRSSHNTRASVITAIERAFERVNTAQLARACASFRGRLEKCVAAKGGFFE